MDVQRSKIPPSWTGPPIPALNRPRVIYSHDSRTVIQYNPQKRGPNRWLRVHFLEAEQAGHDPGTRSIYYLYYCISFRTNNLLTVQWTHPGYRDAWSRLLLLSIYYVYYPETWGLAICKAQIQLIDRHLGAPSPTVKSI